MEAPSAPARTAAEFVLSRRCWWHRPGVAVAVVVTVWLAIAATMDPRGHLGGDAGSKAAVLEAVDRGDHPQFDVGYWAAADDPELRFHPLYYTAVVAGRPQQLSTLPMVWLARPLHAIGGDRLTLVLPIAGGIACALAARALAARFGAVDPWTAYWIVALATPVAIYSLDLWEHTLGLAGIAWGVVHVIDAVDRSRHTRSVLGHAAAAGLLFGAAATVRTEALVYALAFVGGAVGMLLVRRAARASLTLGAVSFVGVAVTWIANAWFERLVLGASLRSARAADVASGTGERAGDRLHDAWITLAGTNYADVTVDRLVGGLIVGGTVIAAWLAARGSRRLAMVMAAIVAAYVLRIGSGLSFVPGLVPVFPLAAVGAVTGWRSRRARPYVAAAVAAIPLIVATSYAGMPGAQWGGRYLFGSGLVLAVAAVATGASLPSRARVVAVVVSVAITATGVVYFATRTHEVGRASDAVGTVAVGADVIVSRVPFLWRELGATYDPAARHLTVVDPDDLAAAFTIARAHGAATVVVLQETSDPVAEVPGFHVASATDLPWIGRPLTALRYQASDDLAQHVR